MKAIIYQASKSAMQSGLGNNSFWILESSEKDNYQEPFMGWVGSKDTNQQIKMYFNTKDEAVNFAQSQNFKYEVIEFQVRKMKPKSYADNFK